MAPSDDERRRPAGRVPFGCERSVWGMGYPMSDAADLVFVNGRVITVDDRDTVADALAVRDGVIVAVGDDATVRARIGPDTRTVDLAGGTLLPGINDSHIHAVSLGMLMPPLTLDVAYPSVRSIADVVDLVRAAAGAHQPGEWITGSGWDPGFLDECLHEPGRQPTRADLDAVSPDNPVFLQDFSYHTGWVNTAALKLAGFDLEADYGDDPLVVADTQGRPTGVLYERQQADLKGIIPPLSDEQRLFAVRSVQHQLAALGVTSITDPALGPADPAGGMGTSGLDTYRSLAASGEALVRVNVLRFACGMSGSSYDELSTNLASFPATDTPDSRMFDVVGTKLFADGIPPNKTAWMHAEYPGGGGHGSLTVAGDTHDEREAELRRMVQFIHDRGDQMGVHVTGDRSAVAVVEAIVAAMEASPRPDPRHYVIHADFLAAREMELCRHHGIGANFNPAIKWTIADLEVDFVGRELADYEWPYRTALDAGVKVSSSSDAPVTMPDWRQGVATMLLRESKASGQVFGADECIGLMEALRTYTITPAWQDRAEHWKGSLEVGKVADLCVLREDITALDPHDIPGAQVTMTVLGGRVTFEDDGTTVPTPEPAAGQVAGHYGPFTRIAFRPDVCCPYDAMVVQHHHAVATATPRP